MVAAIDIDRVYKKFGTFQALENISFQVEEGEFFALLGANGAGKTTLISCLAGLIQPSSGTLKVMGHDVVDDYRAARHALGVVPQELVFDPFLTVRETLSFQSGYFGLKENQVWIDEVLHRLGLADKADNNMRALSGGMKRRVMVAQALVHRPPVIVLDEPTAGVDVELRQSLWGFITELNRAGHTIILTTHYLEEAENFCNRIAIMKKGRLIALENKTELLSRYGKEREVWVRFSGAFPRVQRFAADKMGDDLIKVTLPDILSLEDLLMQLRQQSLTIIDVSVKETDLEQVFVRLTQEEGL